MVRMIFMMLEILLYHVIRHMTRTEGRITDAPKMFAPIAFAKLREFILNSPRGAPFHEANHLTDREFRRGGDIDMDMIFTDTSLDNLDVIRIANLPNEFSYPESNLLRQDGVSILGNPDQMDF